MGNRLSELNDVGALANSQVIPVYDPAQPGRTYSTTVGDIESFINDGLGHVPSGGSSGQVLKKNSSTNYDYSWQADSGGGGSASVFTATVGFSDADYICDGTDDDVQLQAAHDAVYAAGGGTVYIKAGTYNLSAEIEIKSGVQWCGAGRAATNINPKPIPTAGYVFAFTSDGTIGEHDITFRDLSILGMFTHGSFVSGSFGVNPSRNGMRISNTDRWLIENCYFEKCANSCTVGQDPTTDNDTGNPRNTRFGIFRNNHNYRCLGGLQGYSQEAIIWDGNTFEYIADDPMAFLHAQDTTSGSSKAICVNNIVMYGRWQNDNGITALGTLFKIDGGSFGPETIDTVIIANNIGKDLDFGPYVNAFNKLIVHDNIIDTTYRSGMYYIYNGTQADIHDNMFINPNTQGGTAHGGVFCTFPSSYALGFLKIHNNQFFGENNGGKQGVQVQGESYLVQISDNMFYNVSDTAIYLETCHVGSVQNNIFGGTFGTCVRVGGEDILVEGNNFSGATATTKVAIGTFTRCLVANNHGMDMTSKVTGVTGFSQIKELYYCDASGGGFFFGSLPAASSNVGKKWTMIKTDSSSNTVQILPSGSDTIGGQTSFFLRFQNDTVTFVARDLGGGLYDWTPLFTGSKKYRTTNTGTTVFTVTHNLGHRVIPQVYDGTSGKMLGYNTASATPYPAADSFLLASNTDNSFQITYNSGSPTYTVVCQ